MEFIDINDEFNLHTKNFDIDLLLYGIMKLSKTDTTEKRIYIKDTYKLIARFLDKLLENKKELDEIRGFDGISISICFANLNYFNRDVLINLFDDFIKNEIKDYRNQHFILEIKLPHFEWFFTTFFDNQSVRFYLNSGVDIDKLKNEGSKILIIDCS